MDDPPTDANVRGSKQAKFCEWQCTWEEGHKRVGKGGDGYAEEEKDRSYSGP